jgi:molecular chaperone HscB
MNYFEVFGLPRKLGIDPAALHSAFYELSRRWHPDVQRGLGTGAEADVLERSALLNAAYRTLRDPIARAEYLVRLQEGRQTREGALVKPKAPAELLEEMFEVQEMLAEARAGGLGGDARGRLAEERHRLAARQAEESRLAGRLSEEWDAAGPADHARVLAALKDALAERAYLRSVVDDLTAALEAEERHVADHRH